MEMTQFLQNLSSADPTPGGGGASALIGSVAAALGSMVGNLTTGKKKYAQYQEDIERILAQTGEKWRILEDYIAKDAESFAPLAAAYGIPKDQEGREEILQNALVEAARVPLEIARECATLVPLLEELSEKGSRLAISDVAVAAVACRSAIEGAVMNVYINTKLMTDRSLADSMNAEANQLVADSRVRLDKVYEEISNQLQGKYQS